MGGGIWRALAASAFRECVRQSAPRLHTRTHCLVNATTNQQHTTTKYTNTNTTTKHLKQRLLPRNPRVDARRPAARGLPLLQPRGAAARGPRARRRRGDPDQGARWARSGGGDLVVVIWWRSGGVVPCCGGVKHWLELRRPLLLPRQQPRTTTPPPPTHRQTTTTTPQKALAEATGRKEAAIKKAYDDAGDLGAVAAASRGAQKLLFAPKRLTLAGVFKGAGCGEVACSDTLLLALCACVCAVGVLAAATAPMTTTAITNCTHNVTISHITSTTTNTDSVPRDRVGGRRQVAGAQARADRQAARVVGRGGAGVRREK